MPERRQMVRLTTVGGSFAARVMAARLDAEGITVDLRGPLDSPYQFTVGGLSQIDVFVSSEDLEDARLVMLADEVEAIFVEEADPDPEPSDREASPLSSAARHLFWVIIAALVLRGLAPIVHLALGD